MWPSGLTSQEKTNAPFGYVSPKVDTMTVSTRIQSLVRVNEEHEKENIFLLKLKATHSPSFYYILYSILSTF